MLVHVMTCAHPTDTSLVFFAVLGCLLLLLYRVFRSASRMSGKAAAKKALKEGVVPECAEAEYKVWRKAQTQS